ncbi:MAG TPA: amidase [Bryobacteraceae bacterium]|nr:amidase [Bryobacteraceae bacterium]
MAEFPHDLFFATIPELNRLLLTKRISAVELARAFARRLESLGPRYNALALLLEPEAIRAAKAAESDLKRERTRGPLQGIPYGVKDLLSYAGQPTTWGAKPYAAQVFDHNAAVIDKLAAVGAVLVGKLSTVELAGGGGYRFATASLQGPGLNPWDTARWSGGSSSGPAAAVAAGLVPFAIGTETSGSIVTPASYCGVTALRPTYGLVSRFGAMALSWTLDKLGPFARSAEDCGLILQTIAGKDNRDPGSARKSFYYVPQYARPLADLRAAYAPVDFAEWADPAARPAFEAALATLKETGLQLTETRLPDFPYGPVISAVIGAEEASIFETFIRSGQVDQLADPEQKAGLKANLEIPALDYLKAMRIRRLIQDAFRQLFVDVDVLIAPGRYEVATPIAQSLDLDTRPLPLPKDPGMTRLIPAGNLAGLPALVLPCGFANGLPVALQLVGPPFSENDLLAIGRAFQERTGWHRRRPPGT